MNTESFHHKAFSSEEEAFLERVTHVLATAASPFLNLLQERVRDLSLLAGIVHRAPSLFEDLGLSRKKRDRDSLARALQGAGVLELHRQPTKAVLGHSFSLSRLHFFGFTRIICHRYGEFPDELRGQADSFYSRQLFSLMAEQLFQQILRHSSCRAPWSALVSQELVDLWENRLSEKAVRFASFMQRLWDARSEIVPVLGTLLGSSELLSLCFAVPPPWADFLSENLEDQKFNEALEEFLFNMSHEELRYLREVMAKESRGVIDREAAQEILRRQKSIPALLTRKSTEESDELSSSQLYHSFLWRSRYAQLRFIRKSVGPWKTVEEYYIEYFYSQTPSAAEPVSFRL